MLTSLALTFLLVSSAHATPQPEPFGRWQLGVEADGSMAHFGARLNQTGWIQAWNLSAHFVLLPFGEIHFDRLGGVLDGAPQFGVGPVFERFNTRQNFGGLDFEVRYYLTHFECGPLVPWIEGSIAPGGTDLNLRGTGKETRLEGPFAALIQGGVGLSYFFRKDDASYLGLHTEHISNGGFNGPDKNYAINTAFGMVVGVSWFFL